LPNDLTTVERNLLEQKHKYRGLVAKFRSKAFVKDRKTPPSMQFRSGLRELLLNSRVALHPSAFQVFNEWVIAQNQKQLADLVRSPIGFEELTGVLDSPDVPLETELYWVAERIRANSKTLRTFRTQVATIEALTLTNEYETAIAVLRLVELEHGVSLWSVQLRIALEQHAGGLERQKRYASEVRGIYKRGLLNFVAFNTSARNEDRTTIAKYRDDVRAKIDRHRYYSDGVKIYMRYRLLHEIPFFAPDLATILRVEQSHTLIDVYETFISIAQVIVKREQFVKLRQPLLRCLGILDCVGDFRIEQLTRLIEPREQSALPLRKRECSDLLFQGRVAAARRAYRSRTLIYSDIWDLIYEGLACAHSSATAPVATDPRSIPHLIGALLGRRSGFAESYAGLVKLAVNLRGLCVMAGLAELLSQLKRDHPDQQWEPWLISAHSPTQGIEDFESTPASGEAYNQHESGWEIGATENAWAHLHRPELLSTDRDNVASVMLTAIGLVLRHQYQSVINLLQDTEKVFPPRALQSLRSLLILHAYHAIGDKQKVVALIAAESARNDGYSEVLPVVSSISTMQWRDFELVENPLASSIVLHRLWSLDETDATASLLRFVTGKTLKRLGASRPSELVDSEHVFAQHELVYFLKEVCKPNVLDVARILRSSTAVMEERQAICAALRDLDADNSDLYESEVIAISNKLALDEGQWLVDRTRLHVDTEAFTRWATKELAEDFARYRDLLGIQDVPQEDFDDLLSEIETAAMQQQEPMLTQGEADAVLYTLIRRAAEEFINNPIFGLDFYLSKRIRHQSFIGLIRGPLEFSKLITTRKSELEDYNRNDFWIDQFHDSDEGITNRLNEAFRKFAVKFDDVLNAAKETRFHVRSSDKPDGLIHLNIPAGILAIARVVVMQDADFSDVVITLIALFWASLESSLARTREFILEDLKTQIVVAFDEFRASARRCVEPNQAFLQLDTKIGQCSNEVQRKLDEAAAWFTHSDLKAHMRMFTLDQVVSVAVDSALRCQRAFDPKINTQVKYGDQIMIASTLIFVHDVIFVALDNARAHSGMRSPRVSIQVCPDVDEEILTVRVETDNKPQSRHIRERKLVETRRLIESGQIAPRTKKEGDSGFFKLAAVVRQSHKGRINFGFTELGAFFLEVVYSMPLRKVALDLELA
jgi:hypothetical protein